MTDVSGLQQMKTHLKDVQAQLDAIYKEVQEKSSELFSTEARIVFDSYPFVKSVSWAQYTPYFNDGDECTFGACCPTSDSKYGDLMFRDVEDDDDEDIYDYESTKRWYDRASETLGTYVDNPNYDPQERLKPYAQQDSSKVTPRIWHEDANPQFDPRYEEAEKAFKEFFAQFTEDMYKKLFGDHAFCTLTRDGVEVTEYEHE